MKLSYKFSLAAPASAKLGPAPVEDELPFPIPPEYWSVPPLGMIAFPGFECVSTQSPVTFRHPAGHVAIVTVRGVDGAPTEAQCSEVVEASVAQVQEILAKVQAEHGSNTTTEQFQLAGGIRLFAARASPRSFAGSRFFLLYAAVAPKGHLALVTIEGAGEASSMASKLDPIVKAVHFAT
ncbi:hypothetical protein [Ramlibacter sp. WS9]|uniref:hypothetical protein n=1 Tax=Ramlibacter sp. WS9 TaxID=1882741 RepID=UPI0011440552|nr:hypothetical protein [Ramlibacter sp. WS9]ROZ64565.1 hypothetical protein EEB15_28415 [Ramlibacter sp. WS9]